MDHLKGELQKQILKSSDYLEMFDGLSPKLGMNQFSLYTFKHKNLLNIMNILQQICRHRNQDLGGSVNKKFSLLCEPSFKFIIFSV
jgi:hypothetical protein